MNTKYMKEGTKHSHDDSNIFLTAASGHPGQLSSKQSQYSPADHYPKPAESQQESSEIIKNSILSLIKEFKTLTSSPQISHLFNEILYAIDGTQGEKKSLQRISEWLENERNIIKLTRVWNRLKNLKKQADRLGLDKHKKDDYKTNQSSQNSYAMIKAKQPQTSPNKFNRTATIEAKQVNQLKEHILSQISHRQRLIKFQSEGERHEENRKKFLQKKLLKAKEMNKKVKEIYEKNKTLQKDKLYQHHYDNLFEPEEINEKKRGKTVNWKTDNQRNSLSFNNSKIVYSNIRSNQKRPTIKLDPQEMKTQGNTKKNIQFALRQDQKYTKQDMMTFKSLKQLITHNSKGSKSFKSIVKDNKWDSKHLLTQQPRHQYYTKLPQQALGRSISLGKNENFISKKDSSKMNEQRKFDLVKAKKQELEEERLNKIISEAVQKEKKILQIYQRKTLQSKKKKDSLQDSQQDIDHIKSYDSSPPKSLFKKVIVTKKELLDKQRKIFMDIENKIQNKEQFLQERVQKIRQRRIKQDLIKVRHRQAWNQYINLSESISAVQTSHGSPYKKEKQNMIKIQERAVKKSYFTNLKKIQSNAMREKLIGFSMGELKKKLAEIDAEEASRNQQKIIF